MPATVYSRRIGSRRCHRFLINLPMTSTRRIALDDLVACPACDWLHHRLSLASGESARCARCAHELQTARPRTVDRSLAASLSGLLLLTMAVSLPFLSLSRAGIGSRISVIDAFLALWNSDFRWLGTLTLALIILLPLLRFVLLIAVLLPLWIGRATGRTSHFVFRLAMKLQPWAMADIFMVGVAVSLFKVGTVARLQIELAFWCLLAAIGVSWYLGRVLCPDTIWQRLARDAVSA